MRLFELTRPVNRTDAETHLLDAGYLKLGSGSFADVWHKEGSDQVLKLFDGHDHAYYEYIQLCLAHDNPHFPKFFSKPIKVNARFYAIKTELLTKPNITTLQAEVLDDYAHMRTNHRERTEQQTVNAMNKAMAGEFEKAFKPALDLFKQQPQLKEALDLIVDHLLIKHGFYSDIHPTNFMNRGNTLVFTDPVS